MNLTWILLQKNKSMNLQNLSNLKAFHKNKGEIKQLKVWKKLKVSWKP